MASPVLNRLLVVVFAVRLPDYFAPLQAAKQGERGVDKIVERQNDCGLQITGSRKGQQQPAQQVSQRDATDIAQENPGRMPVPDQKSCSGGGDHQPMPGHGGLRFHGDEPDQRDAASDPDGFDAADAIYAVHEIEKIYEPDPADGGNGGVEPEGEETLKHGSGQHRDPRKGGGHLHTQARQGAQRAQIIDPRNRRQRDGGQRNDPARGQSGFTGCGKGDPDPDRQ